MWVGGGSCRLRECVDRSNPSTKANINKSNRITPETTIVLLFLYKSAGQFKIELNSPCSFIHSFIVVGPMPVVLAPRRVHQGLAAAPPLALVLELFWGVDVDVSQSVDRRRHGLRTTPLIICPHPPTYPVGVGAPVALPLRVARVTLGVVPTRPVVVLGGLVVLLAIPAQPRRGRRGRAAGRCAAAAALCVQHPAEGEWWPLEWHRRRHRQPGGRGGG